MVEGVVNARLEAVVSLSLSGPSGRTREIEAVVDTGFSEFLTIPIWLARELGLAFGGVTPMILADGAMQYFGQFHAAVMWDGRPKTVKVHIADGAPLIGMALLEGHSLFVEVVEGGRVVIQQQG